jgi:hypothetical protein
LDDGTKPTYYEWKHGWFAKTQANADQFLSFQELLDYLLDRTTGWTFGLLWPRIQEGCAEPYTSIKEVFGDLNE